LLHNETFARIRVRCICERLVGLCSAKRTAPCFDLGGIRKPRTHLADEIFKTRTDVPTHLGRGFVERDAPSYGVTTDQLLGHFTFCCQIEFGPYDDNRYRLMEERDRWGKESGRWRQGDDEMVPSHWGVWFVPTRSPPLR
jgi:hypothetical protein